MESSEPEPQQLQPDQPNRQDEEEFDYGEEYFTQKESTPPGGTDENTTQETKGEEETPSQYNSTENATEHRDISLETKEAPKEPGHIQPPVEICKEDGEASEKSPELPVKLTSEMEKSSSTEDEWDELQLDTQEGSTTNSTEIINFQEAVQHFDTIDLTEYSEKIQPTSKHSGFASFIHSIVGPAKLNKSLVPQRNLIFTLALIPFDNGDKDHVRILQTLFKTLTKRKLDCPRFGPHWELIGFQGNDPSTDLRGCGMLGLLTLLHLVNSPATKSLAAKMYTLSRDEVQNFPFSVMSINITRMALQILRTGKINKECNQHMKQKQRSERYQRNDKNGMIVYELFQELYEAIFYKIYLIWKNEGKTMTDSGFVVRDVETLAKHKSLDLIKSYRKNQQEKKDGGKAANNKTGGDKGDRIESFVGIEDLGGD